MSSPLLDAFYKYIRDTPDDRTHPLAYNEIEYEAFQAGWLAALELIQEDLNGAEGILV